MGERVDEALSSEDALKISGLDWMVNQDTIYTEKGLKVEGFKANVRSTDNKIIGVVSNLYKVVQNNEAFAFTDQLLGQ